MGAAVNSTEIATTEDAAADTPRYKRMTDADRITALHLADQGLTQVEIAQRLKRSQSTISDWLANFSDSSPLAKRYLRGNALRMARNVVENGKPKDHNEALKGIGVLDEQQQQGLTVIVGGDATVNIGVLVSPLSRANAIDHIP